MKNVFNWTVGSFFRTFGRIIAYIIVGALVAFAFSYKSKAATLTSKALYTEGYWFSGDFNNWGSNNTYSYGLAPFSTNGKAYYMVGNINTTYTGQAYQLSFGFQYNLTAQKYYDITFNFKNRDLTSNLNTSGVHVVSGSSTSTIYDSNNLSLIGVNNSATSGNNTNKLVVRVYAVQPVSYWAIELFSDPYNLTSVNNFGISSITIDEVDTTNSQEIINNQTNNTQNIIDNNNNNTQDIIDNQNELLGSKCSNLFNSSWEQGSIGTAGTTINSGQSVRTSAISTISIEPNTDYSVSLSSTVPISEFWVNYYDGTTFIKRVRLGRDTSHTFTTPEDANKLIIRITTTSDSLTPSNISNTMLVKGSTIKSYCEYGSYVSKLDDTTDAINDVNDTLNDDNIDSATNDASDFFSNFNTDTHGLTSIITAPLSAIQSLSDTSCTPLVLPLPFVNEDLTLPCMREIYVSTFGGFMTLYDTITLGIISYWVLVRIFTLVKDFKNPEHDEVEVMDL